MKYKCKECGRIYREKPKFCKCGNNQFTAVTTKKEHESIVGSVRRAKEKEERQQERSQAPFLFMLFLLFCFGFYVFFNKVKQEQEMQPEINDRYLTSVRQNMLRDFDPSGITNSGYCVISFEIKKDGTVYNKLLIKQSPIQLINDKVMGMLILSDKVAPPPKAYTETPIKIEFGCIADERQVECYSKNIVE